jgi:H(+)-translocating pyrophosphatase
MITVADPFTIVSVGLITSVIALLFVIIFTKSVLGAEEGNDKMKELAEAIHEGAKSFLKKEYTYLAIFCVVVAIALGVSLTLLADANAGIFTVIAFLLGATLSALAGWLGMYIATKANVRTTQACTESLNAGLNVAFKSGAVMGLTVVGFGMFGLSVLYLIFSSITADASTVWGYLSGFGFGASSIALFARVGGGIYTKAADVGADLVGKVESSIPEDDPRNPAVIADNVGDNVGDVAGMGADLFESYVGSIIAAGTLANTQNYGGMWNDYITGAVDATVKEGLVNNATALPFWIAGVGIVCSIIGMFFVKTGETKNTEEMSAEERKTYDIELLEHLLKVIKKGIIIAGVLCIICSAIVGYLLFSTQMNLYYSLLGCIVIGLVGGEMIGSFTEYCTSYSFRPTQSIAEKSDTGPATVIIQGLGVGMISVVVPTVVIVAVIIGCNVLCGVYGVAIAAVGMLSTLGITLATDAYGPVADNAGGIAEMCEGQGVPDFVRDRTDALDALGNTTAATGKGFAIGSAVLTSVGLISAFMTAAGLQGIAVDLNNPIVLSGMLIGAMLPYIFAALTMLSVGQSAETIILEVRSQFYEKPGILQGTEEPNYDKCVAISTEAAIEEMLIPGMLAIFVPAIVGFLLGVMALGGLLVGALCSGFMLAITMANAGGAWDNAKKYVEKGGLGEGKGKKTKYHNATVVGDTVGDPFKDTSGPALNILIKLMSVISLVMAPLYKKLEIDAHNGPTTFYFNGSITAGILFVILAIVCICARKKFDAKNQAFRDEVEAKKVDLKPVSGADVEIGIKEEEAKVEEPSTTTADV